MPTIKLVSSSGLPSPFSSHILIEPALGGRFWPSGAAAHDLGVEYLSVPRSLEYEDALRQALAWANDFALPEILVVGLVEGRDVATGQPEPQPVTN